MRVGNASGLQIAFFTFALLLLAVPVSRSAAEFLGTSGQAAALVTKATPFAMFVAAVLLIPPFRHAVRRLLTATIPARFRSEVAVLTVTSALLPFAFVLLLAFWVWAREGAPGVDEKIRVDVGSGIEKAFDPAGLVMYLVLVPIIGPIIEEVIFRGFLYRALAARWGWIVAMILTSALFGLYHKHFYAAFISSIVFVCVMRRTGSLWSAIVVHGFGNLMLWWPLAGQFVFPHWGRASELPTWYFHIACLVFAVIALPIYVWMSRDRHAAAPTLFLQPDGALPK